MRCVLLALLVASVAGQLFSRRRSTGRRFCYATFVILQKDAYLEEAGRRYGEQQRTPERRRKSVEHVIQRESSPFCLQLRYRCPSSGSPARITTEMVNHGTSVDALHPKTGESPIFVRVPIHELFQIMNWARGHL